MTQHAKHLAQAGQLVFAAVAILALGYWITMFVHTKSYQAQEERKFADELQAGIRKRAASKVEPAGKVREPKPGKGSVIGMLAIPRVGFSTILVEGSGKAELKLAPGHVPGTALPEDRGNVAIAGHRDTSFRVLRFIRKDDIITLLTRRGEYSYRVVSTTVVQPDDIRVLYPTERDALTLVTCYPFSFVGPAPRRFIVRAERIAGGEIAAEHRPCTTQRTSLNYNCLLAQTRTRK
jgi:sortase A